MASNFSRPRRISTSIVTRMWIESATAIVRMMVGAPEEGGVSLTPS
jgi:hypothetical protein